MERKSVKQVGFLTLLEEKQDSEKYIGAMLVVNKQGIPIEFRCTYPIQPTKLQQILFGKSLKNHIAVDICGKLLYEKSGYKPQLIIVNDGSFLRLSEQLNECPVVLVSSSSGNEPKKENEVKMNIYDFEKNTCDKEICLSVVDELKEKLPDISEIIRGISYYIDIFEPFERIKYAVDEIKTKESKFSERHPKL